MLPVGSVLFALALTFPIISMKTSSITMLLAAAIVFAACHAGPSPAATVKDLVRTTERGDIDQAAAYMSQGFVSRQGIDTIKESLRLTTLWIKNDGGVKSIEVLKEDSVGDVAEVTIKLTRGGGDYSVIHYRLVREQGRWKIDAVSSESTVGGHAESASVAINDC